MKNSTSFEVTSSKSSPGSPISTSVTSSGRCQPRRGDLSGCVPTYSQKVQAVRAVERRRRESGGRRATVFAGASLMSGTTRYRGVGRPSSGLNGVVPPDSIQAEVENGTVILRGIVETEFERGEAARLARILGVRGVRNSCHIEGAPDRRDGRAPHVPVPSAARRRWTRTVSTSPCKVRPPS